MIAPAAAHKEKRPLRASDPSLMAIPEWAGRCAWLVFILGPIAVPAIVGAVALAVVMIRRRKGFDQHTGLGL